MLGRCQHPRGFTLVELLLVVAIIGVLIALLLPAIHKVREASAAAQCTNNLKQICLACHSYHTAHGKLPPGYLGPSSQNHAPNFWAFLGEGQGAGTLAFLLPFLEQDAIYDALDNVTNFAVPPFSGPALPFDWSLAPVQPIDPTYGISANAWYVSSNDEVLATRRIKTFLCPSAPLVDKETVGPTAGNPPATQGGIWILTEYQINGPYTIHGLVASAAPYPELTNYLPNCGARGNNLSSHDPVWGKFGGPFDNRTNYSLNQIADGTSNTIFFGEVTGDMIAGAANSNGGLYYAWMGGNVVGTRLGLGGPSNALYDQFASRHTSVVNIALGDGSVKGLRRVVDASVYYAVDPPGMAYPNPVPLPPAGATEWYNLQRLGGMADQGEIAGSALGAP
jgi:prepilin-type N-terminal cleavage/methylation domain-containing protein